MTLKIFLTQEKYAFTIAKLALLIQTILTVVIGALLLLTINNVSYPGYLLSVALLIDILFVLLHLIYRRLYTGPKIPFASFEKKVLIYHIISSILALTITSYIIFVGIDIAYEWMCLALASWIISLTSGILFFYKKYGHRF